MVWYGMVWYGIVGRQFTQSFLFDNCNGTTGCTTLLDMELRDDRNEVLAYWQTEQIEMGFVPHGMRWIEIEILAAFLEQSARPPAGVTDLGKMQRCVAGIGAVQCSAVQCSAVQCSAVQC
jgi:hypothetical protein